MRISEEKLRKAIVDVLQTLGARESEALLVVSNPYAETMKLLSCNPGRRHWETDQFNLSRI